MTGECFICRKYAPLEKHHIFGGACRKKAEKYGLYVYLCHNCHNEPPLGVHHNKPAMQQLHEYGQLKAMAENGWSVEEFRREFYRNYI